MLYRRDRFLTILFCIMFLAVQLDRVWSLKRTDLALKLSKEDNQVTARNYRHLKADVTKGLNAKAKPATENNKFDQFKSSERRVRKGSDPIHNRS
ncbi:hypothetical protein LIER_38666 [Lithospermum erythrorhizon]|uniref:CLAVATA3/ESR (CLE)-related protein 45 n=1 Tax=Lithospermum erythrorhizon TaxID=34254 RepID=A0AAV3Q480_LITER